MDFSLGKTQLLRQCCSKGEGACPKPGPRVDLRRRGAQWVFTWAFTCERRSNRSRTLREAGDLGDTSVCTPSGKAWDESMTPDHTASQVGSHKANIQHQGAPTTSPLTH